MCVCLRCCSPGGSSSSSSLTSGIIGGLIGAAASLVVLTIVLLIVFCRRRTLAESTSGKKASHSLELQNSSAMLVRTTPLNEPVENQYNRLSRADSPTPAAAAAAATTTAVGATRSQSPPLTKTPNASGMEANESDDYDTTLSTTSPRKHYQSIKQSTQEQTMYTSLSSNKTGAGRRSTTTDDFEEYSREDYDQPIS